jgi:sulfur-carrier protein adenylyltransferase/sulfurtransferase
MFGFGSSDFNLSPQELKAKLDGGEKILLVDVRDPAEFAFNRIPGAIHIPLYELANRHGELDPETEIITYCHVGVRSLKAAQILKGLEFPKVKHLAGGIDAWSVQVDPSVPRYR